MGNQINLSDEMVRVIYAMLLTVPAGERTLFRQGEGAYEVSGDDAVWLFHEMQQDK